MKITGIILTYNSQERVETAILSLVFCDEIIVIDNNSTDKTLEIVKSHQKVKIFERELDNDFSAQRNFGLEKANGEWIFFLDSDEEIDKELQIEIEDFIKYRGDNYNGAYFKRVDYLWNRPLLHGESGNIKLLRLGRKGKGIWEGKVHEKWSITGKEFLFLHPIKHYPHENISKFLHKINYYSDLRANELFDKKVKSGFLQIIFYPKIKFIINYIFKQGFRDGTAGFIHAILMSFHSFMVRGKLWQLWKEE